MTISVSVERYLSVKYPNNTFKIKKYLIPVPIAFAILYNLPKFFEFVNCDDNSTFINTISINTTTYQNNTNKVIEAEGNPTTDIDFIQKLVDKAYVEREKLLKINNTQEFIS